ncbi:HAD family hydrolase [Levilactobacillus bambusae]|uniref:Haloacid dehalogenase n=1 Tax=Levilactobacillus bambusae TaxID=2024736 RepID=A0A2V1N061_9LACO|nr:HAD family hydrolase [Levilactobacillus bambusae]PWG00604.1 haloacid dehalogenase [Levilactobacillus bambusae]
MYKMITSDLDETLLRADGSISQANVDAIEAAVSRGVKFVPNTGRSYLTVQALLKQLGLYQTADEYVISYNGGVVVENAGNQIVISHAMPYDEAKLAFDTLRQFETADVHVYTTDQLYIYRVRADDEAYFKTRNVTYIPMATPDFSIFKDQTIMKVIAMNPDETVRHQMFAAIEEAFNGGINVTYSSGIYVEVNHAGVDKGQAVIELGERLGITPDEIVAFGDNSNDLAMLTQVGMPVSVANGIPEVQQAAKLVTDADYEDGVAEGIKKLGLM